MTGVENPIKSDKRKNCYCPTVAKAHLRNFKLSYYIKVYLLLAKLVHTSPFDGKFFLVLIWTKAADKYAGQYVQALSIYCRHICMTTVTGFF